MLGFFQKKNRDKNRETWIIAGLGNPGPEYSDSRHNCGFRAIDKLKEKIAPNEKELQKFKGKYLSCLYNDTKIILLKPETYMNNSGESIKRPCIDSRRMSLVLLLFMTILIFRPVRSAFGAKAARAHITE